MSLVLPIIGWMIFLSATLATLVLMAAGGLALYVWLNSYKGCIRIAQIWPRMPASIKHTIYEWLEEFKQIEDEMRAKGATDQEVRKMRKDRMDKALNYGISE